MPWHRNWIGRAAPASTARLRAGDSAKQLKRATKGVNRDFRWLRNTGFTSSGVATLAGFDADTTDTAHPTVLREVRGLGLMIGVELAEGIAAFAESKRPASVQIVERLHAAGLLTIPAGARVFRLLPPLNISKQDADEGLAIIESVIKELAS